MLPRGLTSPVNWALDNLVPPALRDAGWFMAPLLWLLFGRRAGEFTGFRAAAPGLTPRQFRAWYARTADLHIRRPTDLTRRVAAEVLASVAGEAVLDVGAGRGWLVDQVAGRVRGPVVGVDVTPPRGGPGALLACADGEALPFRDGAFDTVTCCHVLEHVQDAEAAVRELRRVARRRLVVVVPRQREYRYTFDLHLRFFPYASSLQQLMRRPGARCEVVDNDLLYVEELGDG
jgi:SAM-dependent methyltransferase